MNNHYDVAVIGSGPAGSLAAIHLAQKGLKTVVFEKEELPRRKVCAGGLVKRAYDLLPDDLDYPVEVHCDTFEARVLDAGISLSETRQGLIKMVNRRDFDFSLVQYAQKKGAVLKEKEEVTALQPDDEQVEIQTKKGNYIASYVVLAEGANSRLAKTFWGPQPMAVPSIEADVYVSRKGMQRFQNRAIFDLDVVPYGYGWVFPKSDHLSIGLVTFKKGKIDLQTHFDNYMRALEITENVEVKNRKGFLIPVQHRKGPFMKDRILLVGDAAGFADPISAEGLSYAIMSGISSANAILEGFPDQKMIAKLYQNNISDLFLKELQASGRFTSLTFGFTRLRNFIFRNYGTKVCRGILDVIENKRTIRQLSSPRSILLHLLKLR